MFVLPSLFVKPEYAEASSAAALPEKPMMAVPKSRTPKNVIARAEAKAAMRQSIKRAAAAQAIMDAAHSSSDDESNPPVSCARRVVCHGTITQATSCLSFCQ